MAGTLVLTGETASVQRRGADDRPDYLLARIDQLLSPSEWERRGRRHAS